MKCRKVFFLSIVMISVFFVSCRKADVGRTPWTRVATFAGMNREFGEPFGLALDRAGVLYVSDGERGAIFRLSPDGGAAQLVTDKLDTPSQIAFDRDNFLLVADAGSHAIKKVDVTNGNIETIAGVDGKKGFADGEAKTALFTAPIGIAVHENKIFVADTYNDRIRVIENGQVSTLAGGSQGFSDGAGAAARFDTPCGIAVLPGGGLLVADTNNRRLRKIDAAGNVTTFAGTGEIDSADGLAHAAKFVLPTAVAVDAAGAIYVADGNSVRALNRQFFTFVETVSNTRRGYADGALRQARVNRPSGLAVDARGNLFAADAENQTVRVFSGEGLGREITREEIENLRFKPAEFRALQPARWTYDPPEARRDIAGTLGEIRGEIDDDAAKQVWFHNGLDIAGAYGETARFIRSEKVLNPFAAEGFGDLRERLRMPTIGYIHIRLGRDQNDKPFGDERFMFSAEPDSTATLNFVDQSGRTGGTAPVARRGALAGVRVARGTRFAAGEAIGTLNRMNHVHLVAGRAGAEMNALDALTLPNASDKSAPVIEKVSLFRENWSPIETPGANQRINLNGRTRVVVRAFDQMDGGAAYRKLSVYTLGYQILKPDKTPVTEEKTTVSFAKMPDEDFVRLVYARGSQSGYTPQTVFEYIVTNEIAGDSAREGFLETQDLPAGNYVLRVFATDFFGNKTVRDLEFEIPVV